MTSEFLEYQGRVRIRLNRAGIERVIEWTDLFTSLLSPNSMHSQHSLVSSFGMARKSTGLQTQQQLLTLLNGQQIKTLMVLRASSSRIPSSAHNKQKGKFDFQTSGCINIELPSHSTFMVKYKKCYVLFAHSHNSRKHFYYILNRLLLDFESNGNLYCHVKKCVWFGHLVILIAYCLFIYLGFIYLGCNNGFQL